MDINSLQDLFLVKLQQMYDAERQGLEAMPRMAQQVSRPEARRALETHRAQTEEHVRRLERIFQREGQSPKRQECKSMKALIEEAEEQLGKIRDDSTRDAFLIAAQQAVEHHEIADYGTARTWARELGRGEAAVILQQTLDEEEEADRLLTEVAEGRVNEEAADRAESRGDRDVTRAATSGDRASALNDTVARRGSSNAGDVRDVGA